MKYLFIVLFGFQVVAVAKGKNQAKLALSEAVLICKDFYSPTDEACPPNAKCCPPVAGAQWEIEGFSSEVPPIEIKGKLPACNFDPCGKQIKNDKLLAKGIFSKDETTLGRVFQMRSFKSLRTK
jgi:hypothetical protein